MKGAPEHQVTVILRRIPRSSQADAMRAVQKLRDHARTHSGFVDAKDSLLPAGEHVDLVTVYSFATPDDLGRWENDPRRIDLVSDVDRLSVDISERAAFDGLSMLTPDRSRGNKHETVAILIVLIVLLGLLADLVMPPVAEPWRTLVVVSVNVCLISYVLLPWSLRALAWIKDRVRG